MSQTDGEADHEDGGDAEPSLAAPENASGSQMVRMRYSDRAAEAPEIAIHETAIEMPPVAAAELIADPSAIHIPPL